jgi:FAD:protein FMN transferase
LQNPQRLCYSPVPMKRLATTACILLFISIAVYGGGNKEERFSDAHFALGTVCTITLYGQSNEKVFQAAFDLIDDIESKMSVSLPNSEVAAINRSAGIAPVEVSEDTFAVIEQSLEYVNTSIGKFDITVQPLVQLWGIGTEQARIPAQAEIDEAIGLISANDVVLSRPNSAVFLKRKGMAVDLGGIAKGYAADRVKDYLLDQGFSKGILNFGGNIVTFGEKAGGDPWVIGIQDPYDTRGTPVGTLDLSEGSVVTSGIYERYFERDGRRYHHILDPDTGYPVENELASVSIVADQAIVADVFSTIVFALGVTKGMSLLESIPKIDGVLVTKGRKVLVTSGLMPSFSVSNTDYFLESSDL